MCEGMRYGKCVHFIGIIVLHIDLNKSLKMQNDVKFHRLLEYVLTFHKTCLFDNNILKIQRNLYFSQGYIIRSITIIILRTI